MSGTAATPVTRSQLLAWTSEANRAPSVHNVQPARFEWRRDAEGTPVVRLYSDQSRRLLAGDPLRIDEGTSLGAAWEGLRLACERDGYRLELQGDWLDPGLSPVHPSQPELRLVATARLSPIAPGFRSADPLAEHVFRRKTYRGPFRRALPSQLGLLESALATEIAAENAILLQDRRSRDDVRRLLQEATARLARHEAVQSELLRWLRLDPRDPRYQEDGLNAEALDLPRPLARLAGSAMRAASHPAVLRTGFNRLLLDETPQLESASAVLVLYVPRDAGAVTRGRLLYRAWLQVTRYGLAACPMSALADDTETSAALLDYHSQPETVSVLNVLRVGVSPRSALPLTPRLQPERLVVPHESGK